MNNSSPIKYGKYMTELMAAAINDTEPPAPFEDINWQSLYQLSLYHNVAVMVYPALRKLSVPQDILKKFEYNYFRMMSRDTRQDIEAQRIFDIIAEMKIPYLKLKGIYLKHQYPAPYMRTHADVDICVSSEHRTALSEVMLSEGYALDMTLDYHDEYSKDNFYIFEIHSNLLPHYSPFFEVFEDPFSKARPLEGEDYAYVLKDEYFYMHLLLHLYKHFVSEGCGVRLFADLYVFRKNHPDMDENFINELIDQYGLSDFHYRMSKLTACFFEGKEFTERYVTIAKFIFSSGEYGHADLKHIPWITASKTANITTRDKIRYFAGNWFPGVSMMKYSFPVLKKAPFLLPFCWVIRVFRTLFFRRSSLKKQYEELKRLNSEQFKDVKTIHNLAGIK